ncbi:helicase [Ruficoccus amylovorans]|uniref:Helicase n=1 Tax=Ruficoccus amylovorans TaxID=1804625 RepID=A0A842HF30_9BACT|nr:helicase C-terminal domain-containing protein [Ruficoccus amylovorans]MBC2594236.1 helicase [Ruficoccus amylovorans]
MMVHEEERRASLGISEFAQFRLGPRGNRAGAGGLWRMRTGLTWHQNIQQADEAARSGVSSEIAISGLWMQDGWTLHLHGRIDQVEETMVGWTLREIKTLESRLPQPAADLRERYPAYFCQLAAYVRLARVLPEFRGLPVKGELVFVEISEGLRQVVPLEGHDEGIFDRQVETVCAFLNERRESARRRHSLSFAPAFETFRPEQVRALDTLSAKAASARTLLLEAPTGFGKTGLVLQYALGQLRDGLFDKVIYCTGKSTGQLQVDRQLRRMAQDPEALRTLVFRNRSEHAIATARHTCDATGGSCHEGIEEAWAASGIVPWELWAEGQPDLERVRLLGARTGVCPYEISKSLLPHADVWVGDYNYVFSPWHQQVFLESAGFDPARTLLIVDEAHNLASRVSALFSFGETAAGARYQFDSLRYLDCSARFLAQCEEWVDLLDSLRPRDALDISTEYEIADQLERLARSVYSERLPWDDLSPALAESLHRLPRLHAIISSEGLDRLCWSPARGELRVSCLDAAGEIAARLESFGQSLLMSATLSPLEDFCAETGLEPSAVTAIRADAPWRDHAYRVAVDARVDTRLNTRGRHMTTTATTIDALCAADSRPTAVFFPSYQYAETIRAYLEQINPQRVVAMQPRGIDLDGQLHFIEESLLCAHAVFFVLGSGFSEGIDELGGRIGQAMIVGPALPEVNAEQKARLARFEHLGRPEAFRRVYQLPAMRKINQALGRLVRGPGQQARVLLHCRRFADSSYQRLLDPVFIPEETLNTDQALREWIETTSMA